MSDDKVIRLKNFLTDSLYIILFRKYLLDNNPDNFIPNTSSTANVYNLRFNTYIDRKIVTTADYLLSYQVNEYNLAQIMNNIMRAIGEKIPTPELIDQELNIYTRDPLIHQVVWKWFKNKNKNKSYQTAVYVGQNIVHDQEVSLTVKKFGQIFVDVFWERCQELDIPQINVSGPAPQVIWKNLKFALGKYYINKHIIAIDIRRSSLFEHRIREFMQGKITNETFLQLTRDSGAREYIGIQYPASVLIHELSHAWRRTSHSASHQPINLTIRGETKQHNFEEAANLIFQEILYKNFVELFLTRLIIS